MHGAKKKKKTTNTAYFTDCTHNWNIRTPKSWRSLIQISIRIWLEKNKYRWADRKRGTADGGADILLTPLAPMQICNILRRLWKCLIKYSISFTSPISVLPTLLALGSRSYARKVMWWKYKMCFITVVCNHLQLIRISVGNMKTCGNLVPVIRMPGTERPFYIAVYMLYIMS